MSEASQLTKALLARDELLMTWLVTLPWRQRNLRECRVGRDQGWANVFKATRPRSAHLKLPKWLTDLAEADPTIEFWQFAFKESETKNGHSVRGVIPRTLVSLLEEYLHVYRPVLCSESDPGTLFVSHRGKALSLPAMTDLVATLTTRHVGRRVTPHVCRDIFAYKWLDEHPEDYLTLSKILWHKDVKTTLQTYGRNFDESNGAARVDEWLEQRRMVSTQ